MTSATEDGVGLPARDAGQHQVGAIGGVHDRRAHEIRVAARLVDRIADAGERVVRRVHADLEIAGTDVDGQRTGADGLTCAPGERVRLDLRSRRELDHFDVVNARGRRGAGGRGEKFGFRRARGPSRECVERFELGECRVETPERAFQISKRGDRRHGAGLLPRDLFLGSRFFSGNELGDETVDIQPRSQPCRTQSCHVV
jgi:hypothetical protein